MSIMQKLVLAWKGRKVLASLSDAGKGFKKISFWVTLLGSLLSYMAALKELVPPTYALIITTVLTAAYNILRGMDKAVDDNPTKPWYRTTEDWLGIGAQIQNAIVTMQTGGVSTDFMLKMNTILTAAMMVGRDLAHVEPKDVLAAAPPEAPTPNK